MTGYSTPARAQVKRMKTPINFIFLKVGT